MAQNVDPPAGRSERRGKKSITTKSKSYAHYKRQQLSPNAIGDINQIYETYHSQELQLRYTDHETQEKVLVQSRSQNSVTARVQGQEACV